MKLLAFTDLHCNKAALNEIKNKAINEKPDLIVCCGDLSNFTSGLNEIAKFLNSLNIKILIIPGNHETNIDINEICGKYNNLINIHLASYEIDNYLFLIVLTSYNSIIIYSPQPALVVCLQFVQ